MWSHLYGYYEIRSSASYDSSADTDSMRAIMDSLPELKRVGLINYANAPEYPWIELGLVKGRQGSFSYSDDTWNREFNMIPIVCAKSDNGKVPALQVAFLIKLATILNWELIEEENDEGEEDAVLYSPN